LGKDTTNDLGTDLESDCSLVEDDTLETSAGLYSGGASDRPEDLRGTDTANQNDLGVYALSKSATAGVSNEQVSGG
jgi:hypothetical protein